MAKSKLNERHTISIEGTLDINEDGTMNMEVDDLGVKDLSEVFKSFNGCNIKLSATLATETTK